MKPTIDELMKPNDDATMRRIKYEAQVFDMIFNSLLPISSALKESGDGK